MDTQTGLYNKHFFNSYLEVEVNISLRRQHHLSLIIADIDHFKKINDTYGHPVGDAVLAALGQILKKHCRDSDIPVRWGGEEFCLLLPETDLQGAFTVAEKIRQTVAKHPFEQVRNITLSLGIAELKTDTEDLCKQADAAL